jgi:hypothetical protein
MSGPSSSAYISSKGGGQLQQGSIPSIGGIYAEDDMPPAYAGENFGKADPYGAITWGTEFPGYFTGKHGVMVGWDDQGNPQLTPLPGTTRIAAPDPNIYLGPGGTAPGTGGVGTSDAAVDFHLGTSQKQGGGGSAAPAQAQTAFLAERQRRLREAALAREKAEGRWKEVGGGAGDGGGGEAGGGGEGAAQSYVEMLRSNRRPYSAADSLRGVPAPQPNPSGPQLFGEGAWKGGKKAPPPIL